jgi:hypothetical protein
MLAPVLLVPIVTAAVAEVVEIAVVAAVVTAVAVAIPVVVQEPVAPTQSQLHWPS